MSTPTCSKINLLMKKLIPDTVLTLPWLAARGVSKDLARRYVSSGWLERVGHGAYIRAGDRVDWQGALYALQTQLNFTVHVAGLSALQLKGQGHYLPLETGNTIHLFSDSTEHLPAWFFDREWSVKIEHHCVRLFNSPDKLSVSSVVHSAFQIGVSSPERAAFELLYCVKNNADFDHARTVFRGLGTLRPKEIQALLMDCRSVRVKRLFLWMANDCGHPWLKYVDAKKTDLGSGKRVIYEGGELDKELLITVPRQQGESDV